MALTSLAWPDPPALTNADDGPTSVYHMGVSCGVNVDGTPSPGLRWRVPDSVTPAPPGGYFATLWQLSPDVLIRSVPIVPIAGGDQDFLWAPEDGPAILEDQFDYIWAVTTIKYSFRAAGGNWGFTTPGGELSALAGRLAATGDPNSIPVSAFDSYYYVSPLVGTVDTEDIELSGALSLGAVATTGALSGLSSLSGTAALGAVAMSGAATTLSSLAGAVQLPALAMSGTLSIPAELSGSVSLPGVRVSGALGVPLPDTSSPAAPISTVTRPAPISTITRATTISTGARGAR